MNSSPNAAFNNKPSALLFDLDGTLMDTAADFYPTVNALRAEHRLAPLENDIIREQVSNGGRALTRLALDMPFDDPEFETQRDRFLALYTEHLGDSSDLFDGMDALLAICAEKGIAWGVVTNKPRLYTELLFERLQSKLPILDQCQTLICPDDVKHSKPDPEPLLLAASQLGLNADRCWYAGDHIRDIQAGAAANMPTIATAWGYIEQDDDIEQWQADWIIKQPLDILERL